MIPLSDAGGARRRMPLSVALAVTLLLPAALAGGAAAATLQASAPVIAAGQTTSVDLVLDPGGVDVGAYLIALGTSDPAALLIDAVVAVTGATGCSSLVSGSSFDGQCIPPIAAADRPVIATVQLTALAAGGQLLLTSGNVTDDNTFLDIAFAPGVLVTVPEPSALALVTVSLLAVSTRGRRR